MRRVTLDNSSERISVVDDVGNSFVAPSPQVDFDEDQEVIELGDGYLEVDGCVFYENLDEIAGAGSDEGPGIPHETVMAEIREMLTKPR